LAEDAMMMFDCAEFLGIRIRTGGLTLGTLPVVNCV
jgi:hypothetical protein